MICFGIHQAFIAKFFRFAAVGFIGLFIDFGSTYFCKEKIKIQKYIANAIGFMLAATVNYYLNRVWTFSSKNPNVLLEYSEFLVVSLIGLGLNTLILWFLVSRYKLNFYLSKFFAVGIVIFWNFFANMFFTFH